jgi:hypothetical protein
MDTRQKKPYETPALTVWGSLRDLTQSNLGNLDFKAGTAINDEGGGTIG